MMTKSNALRTAGVAAMLGLLIFALSTARTRARQSGVAQTLEAKDPVTYFIAEGNRSTGYRPGDRELALWAKSRHPIPSLSPIRSASCHFICTVRWCI